MTRYTKRRSLASLARQLEERQQQSAEDRRVATYCRRLINMDYPIVARAVRGGAAVLEPLLPRDLVLRARTLRSLLYVALSEGHCQTRDRYADPIVAQLDWLTWEEQQQQAAASPPTRRSRRT